jgi:hypothetical protein
MGRKKSISVQWFVRTENVLNYGIDLVLIYRPFGAKMPQDDTELRKVGF